MRSAASASSGGPPPPRPTSPSALPEAVCLLKLASTDASCPLSCPRPAAAAATDDLGSATNRYDRTYDVAEEAECACDGAAFQMLVDAVAREIADALGRPVSLMPLAVSTGLISCECMHTGASRSAGRARRRPPD